MEWKHLVYSRNKLMMKILWFYYLIDTLFYLFLDPHFETIWPPVGLVFCIIATILAYKEKWAFFSMYSIVLLIFLYLFYINYNYPYLVNYIFIFFALLLCSVYQSKRVIVLATFLAISSFIYFFMTNYEVIFTSISEIDIIYFILLAVVMMVFSLFYTQFTNSLWEKAYEREKSAREQLYSVERYLQFFFDNTNDSIIMFNSQCDVISMNESFRKLYGISSNKYNDTSQIQKNIQRYLKLFQEFEERNEAIVALEFEDLDINGFPLIVEVTLSPVYDVNRKLLAYSCIARDISEKKIAEKLVINSAKLKVAGEMAAGIVHEIRNPLSVIKGFIQLLGEEVKDNSYYSLIIMELDRINTILGDFLLLAKPQDTYYEWCNIVDIIEDVKKLFEIRATSLNIEIQTVFEDNDLLLECDKNQLKQVFINFVKNSIEALPNGGVIRIEGTKNNGNIRLTFYDNGKGISEDILYRLGEIFLSTKEEGTGLGISIAKRIIDQHNGEMTIESKENEETRILIKLPVNKVKP